MDGSLRPETVRELLHKDGIEFTSESAKKAIMSQIYEGVSVKNGKLIGFNDLETTNPELAQQWHPTKNGEASPYDVSDGSSVKAWWLCNKGHEWQAATCHRTRNHSGCPYCSGRYAIKDENDLATLYPDLVKEWNYEKNGNLRPEQFAAYSSKKVWWKCKKGHEWQARIADRNKGRGCPICRKIKKQEKIVRK